MALLKLLYPTSETQELVGGKKAYHQLRRLGILPPPIRISVRNGLHPAEHIEQAVAAFAQACSKSLPEPRYLGEGPQKAAARRDRAFE
jgi:hypothetical protein